MADEGDVTAETPTPPQEKAAVWEDFIDIVYAPSAVYARRRGRTGVGVLLVLTLVLVALFFAYQRVLTPIMDLEMQRSVAEAMAGEPEMDPEQLERFGGVGRLFGVLGLAVAFPVGVVLVALVTWALARLFGAAVTFGGMLLVVTYAQIVRIGQFAVSLFQGLLLDLSRLDSLHDVALSPARFLDQPETSDLVIGIASRFDLFTLWATALIAIGVRVVAGLPKAGAWTVAALVWLLATIPTLVGALLSG